MGLARMCSFHLKVQGHFLQRPCIKITYDAFKSSFVIVRSFKSWTNVIKWSKSF